MGEHKHKPKARGGKECPVCGQTTYSSGGIHPQCAVTQQDQLRKAELKKKAESEDKKKTSAGARWQKKCPSCGNDVHVRLKKCSCGRVF